MIVDKVTNTIPSKSINGITSVEKNRLYFNNGRVKFNDGTPVEVKKIFLQNGSGSNLSNYYTEIFFDEKEKQILMQIESVYSRIQKMLHSMGISKPKKPLLKTFSINSTNPHLTLADLKSFISGKELQEFVQANRNTLSKRITKGFIKLIDTMK